MAVRMPKSAAHLLPGRSKSKDKPSRPSLPSDCTILCLDVSSTATGLAIMRTGPRVPELLGMKLISPTASWAAERRIDRMADEILMYLRGIGYCDQLVRIGRIVIEWSDGSKWRSKDRAGSWSHSVVPLANAQGAIRQAVRPLTYGNIETVTSTEWTHGVKKEDRAAKLRLIYPEYDAIADDDKGFDVADAIGIGVWRAGL